MRFCKASHALDFKGHDADSDTMADILTISERKQARVAAIRSGLSDFEEELRHYARTHHGRFVIFGSTVTDRLHYGSDIDILADFPRDHIGDAMDFANALGARFDLPVDVLSYHHCKPDFLERVLRQSRVLT